MPFQFTCERCHKTFSRKCRPQPNQPARYCSMACRNEAYKERSWNESWRTHGLYHEPEYRIWADVKTRCHNTRSNGYYKYGARGIVMCDEWRDSFESFYRDMGPRPSPQYSIERLNNDGPYAPWNCTWATLREQANNKRNNHRLTFRGETLNLTQWATRIGMPMHTLLSRIRNGWSVERALTTPLFNRGQRLVDARMKP